MKRKLTLAGVVVIALAVAGMIYLQQSGPSPAMADYSKIMAAAQAHKDDLTQRGAPIPESVTLQELLKLGLLQETDVSGFKDLQVTVSLKTGEAGPQQSLMTVRFPDGREIMALSDGSVQQVKR